MRIFDLIENLNFSFNAPFRIVKYLGEGDETQIVYDSEKDTEKIPFEVMTSPITAINTGDDGVLEIEYIE